MSNLVIVSRRSREALLIIIALMAPRPALSQHAGHSGADTVKSMPGMEDMSAHMAGVLGIPHTRLGSGTSWQPEAAPHYGWHFVRGGWSLMVHGIAYA